MLTLAPDVATRKTSHSRRNIQGHVPVRKAGRSVDPSVDILHQAVLTCVHLLEGDGGRTAARDPRVAIALLFGQPPSTETLCIAMAIVTNALAFHEAITRELDLPSVADLRGPASNLPKRLLLSQWARVLPEASNCPIFKLASDIIRPIPNKTAGKLLGLLSRTAEQLLVIGLTGLHDIVGRTLQRLSRDRKFLAAFYTLPASASLLAELALSRLHINWDDPAAYTKLWIADLACGTGTLLSAAYNGIRARYRKTGHDDHELHRSMIEQQIIAADVMPMAACLAASQLAAAHPTERFSACRVYTMPYGAAPAGGVSLGALDLVRGPGFGSPATQNPWSPGSRADPVFLQVDVPDESVDIVIMNPPFTRPTNHKTAAVPVPSFAGLSVPPEVQRLMSLRLIGGRRSLPKPVGNGYAGLASDFLDLAHAKVRPGGVDCVRPPHDFLSRALMGSRTSPLQHRLRRHIDSEHRRRCIGRQGIFSRYRHG